MSRIGGKDTKPEIILRKKLWAEGYRYRLYEKKLPGKPDLVFPGKKKVIFVNGCFWHKHNCRDFKWPKSNKEFWKNKIGKNIERDKKNYQLLLKKNWEYIVVWECETKKSDFEKLFVRVERFLNEKIEGN